MSGPIYKGVWLVGHTVFHDLFSDGKVPSRILTRNVPVEILPTPDKILSKNRYFWKLVVLFGKKPCNLAAFSSSRKREGNWSYRASKGLKNAFMA
jgi:hypothetical protein